MTYPPGTPNASTYRFVTSHILTGRILSDSLPLMGQTCNRQINSVGQFEGALPLTDKAWAQKTGGDSIGFGSSRQVATWINALTPWKSILWILQDEQPIWNGPIISWDPTGVGEGTLPIQAATMEEIFKHRLISDDLIFKNMDIFDIFREFLIYALGKQPNGNIAGTGRFATQSGIIDNVAQAGISASVTENLSLKAVYQCWNDLVNNYGMEYTFTPAKADANSLFTRTDLGVPVMGRKYTDTKLQMNFPSKDVVDYMWQAISTAPANRIWVTGSGSAAFNAKFYISQPPHGQSTNELNQGFPLLEDSFAINGPTTSQAQVNTLADNLLPGTTIQSSLTPIYVLGATAHPRVRDVMLGDEVGVTASSPMHPVDPNTGGPGIQAKFRISGWTLTFPSATQAEQVQFQLGAGTAASLEGFLFGGFVQFGGFGFGGKG